MFTPLDATPFVGVCLSRGETRLLSFRQRCVVYQTAKALSSRLACLFVRELRCFGTGTNTITANVYEIEVYHVVYICQDNSQPVYSESKISRQKIEPGI
jgi:hypothetical protein